jgi:hypothetical protein
MLEEFTALASTSGFAAARHWYWRQSVKTIAHLVGSEFRVAPLLLMLRGPNDSQEKKAELAQKVRLEQVYIDFPGRQRRDRK